MRLLINDYGTIILLKTANRGVKKMFEDSFFDKRTTTTYRVFRLMKAHSPNNFTINRLNEESGLTYSQTYNAYQEIMADLAQMYPSHIKHGSDVTFTELAGELSVDEYRFHLLNQSMAFRFFDYAFRAEAPDVHAFCQDAGISISTLRRRVAAFRHYMTAKGLRLNASTWAPEGPEAQLRILILTFYKLAYRGVGWPFSEREFKQARQMFAALNVAAPGSIHNATAVPNKQDVMLLAIQAHRIACGHFVTPSEQLPTVAKSGAGSPVYNRAHFPQLSEPDLACERDYYDFCQMHYVSLRETLNGQDQTIMAYLRTIPPVHEFAQGMLDFLLAACQEGTKEAAPHAHDVLLANLHRAAFSFLTLHGNFAMRLDFLNPEGEDATRGHLPDLIHEYFAQLEPEKVGALAGYYDTMAVQLYGIIAPDFPELNADHRLKVAVIVDHGTFMSRDLLTFLNGIHFVEIVSPNANILPDVIITTLNTTGVLDRYYSPARPPSPSAGHQLAARRH